MWESCDDSLTIQCIYIYIYNPILSFTTCMHVTNSK
jgi:hypothetical protein